MIYAIGNRLDGLGKKILEGGKNDSHHGIQKTGAFFLFDVQCHQSQGKQQNGGNQNNIFFVFKSLFGHR